MPTEVPFDGPSVIRTLDPLARAIEEMSAADYLFLLVMLGRENYTSKLPEPEESPNGACKE